MSDCGPCVESCCASLEVPGGTFYRSYDGVTYAEFKDKSNPAIVSGFRLDKYEVTVGRFRQFVSAVEGGWTPAPGSGTHTHLSGGRGLTELPGDASVTYESGWDATNWNSNLPKTSSAWDADLGPAMCGGQGDNTWTPAAATKEREPITCVTWYEAYAFCIWDGGFLPSEAEWNYAAAGGGGSSGQRVYPWSSPSTSTTIDCSLANYGGSNWPSTGCVATGANEVGSESPGGDGAFGQADLAGNVFEWIVDWFASAYVNPCADCANLTRASCPTTTLNSCRTLRGGNYSSITYAELASARSFADPKIFRSTGAGVRCARTP